MEGTVKIRILSLLTTLAFLANIFLPFLAVYNPSSAQAASPSEISSLLGEKILICSGNGFKWVTWDELEQEGPSDSEGPHYECPLCYVSAHATKNFLPAAPVVFSPLFTERQKTGRTFFDVVEKGRFASYAYRSRAPPHFA